MNQIQISSKPLEPGEIQIHVDASQTNILRFSVSLSIDMPFSILRELILEQLRQNAICTENISSFILGNRPISKNCQDPIREIGIRNHSMIHVLFRLKGGGCEPFVFSNMKNMKLEAPGEGENWRIAKSGLNLPGICQNDKCEAYKLQVICPKGNGKFNMAEEIENMVCPQCKSDKVTAEGDCYFWDCIYNYQGCVKMNGVKTKKVGQDQECPKGKFVHFLGKQQEDQSTWVYLTITTRKM